MHYKIKQKIIRLVREKRYYQLGYYLFDLIFRDEIIHEKRDKYIGVTPQKTEKLMERRFPPNTHDQTIIEECSNFVERMRQQIAKDQLEP